MKLDDFVQEMLSEIKDLKDLAKGELPEIAKEYIRAHIILHGLGVALGAFLIMIAISCGIYALHLEKMSSDQEMVLALTGLFTGLPGVVMTSINLCELLNFYLQPRRMAIKAITSLK